VLNERLPCIEAGLDTTSMSQLMAIRLEVLGLLVPFLSLAVIDVCGFIRPTRLNLWKKAA
jgi:hypothetical protein